MARSSQIWVATWPSATRGSPCGTPPLVRTTHAYNACSARARARVSTLVRDIEPVEEVRHFERGHRRFVALVPHVAAGARLGLSVVVSRQHAEANRDVELGARRGET